nr:DUF3261 domain-containing protein [uncultured Dongia sp.]
MTGCATVPVADEANSPYFAPNHLLTLPQPGDLGRPLEMSQMITVRHDNDVFAFEGHIGVTPERFYLVGVDGMGRRAMSVAWDKSGKITAERADWLPAAVRPGPMLADIILIYWPATVLRPALENAGAVLVDGPTSRSISIDGKEILKIDYLAGGPQATTGRLRYRNSAWGYEIDVQSVEATP